MKKSFVYGIILFFVLILIVNSAYSQSSGQEAGEKVRSVGQWFLDVFSLAVFGESEASDPIAVFTHLFMGFVLLVLFFLIFEISGMVGKNSFFNFLIAFGITFLILVSLPKNFFYIVMPSYGALGGLILFMLPLFVIFIFSLRLKSLYMARMVWIFFTIYYAILYYYEFMNLEVPGTSNLVLGIIGLTMIFTVNILRGKYLDEKVKVVEGLIEEGARKREDREKEKGVGEYKNRK